MLHSKKYSQQYSKMLLFLPALFVIIPSTKADSKKNLRYLSETHFEFSIELYKEMAKSREENIVLAGLVMIMG